MLASIVSATQGVARTRPQLFGLASCMFISCSYVSLLYIWKRRPRNDPASIRRKFASVACGCGVAWIPMALLKGRVDIRHELGLSLTRPGCVLKPLLLTGILFAGPLLFKLADPEFHEQVLSAVEWAQRVVCRSWQGAIPEDLVAEDPWADQHLIAWRNLVVSPVTEEFCFRACMAPLLINAFDLRTTVLIAPLFFGACHLHHLNELVRHQKVPLRKASLMVAFQFGYTTVFGWYETLVFLKSKSVLPPIIIHSICNWMGFPDVARMRDQSISGGSSTLPLTLLAAGLVSFVLLLGNVGVS